MTNVDKAVRAVVVTTSLMTLFTAVIVCLIDPAGWRLFSGALFVGIQFYFVVLLVIGIPTLLLARRLLPHDRTMSHGIVIFLGLAVGGALFAFLAKSPVGIRLADFGLGMLFGGSSALLMTFIFSYLDRKNDNA